MCENNCECTPWTSVLWNVCIDTVWILSQWSENHAREMEACATHIATNAWFLKLFNTTDKGKNTFSSFSLLFLSHTSNSFFHSLPPTLSLSLSISFYLLHLSSLQSPSISLCLSLLINGRTTAWIIDKTVCSQVSSVLSKWQFGMCDYIAHDKWAPFPCPCIDYSCIAHSWVCCIVFGCINGFEEPAGVHMVWCIVFNCVNCVALHAWRGGISCSCAKSRWGDVICQGWHQIWIPTFVILSIILSYDYLWFCSSAFDYFSSVIEHVTWNGFRCSSIKPY